MAQKIKQWWQFTMHLLTLQLRVTFRVARWFVFKLKIPVWVNFGGPLND
jgi:hypothetical protein